MSCQLQSEYQGSRTLICKYCTNITGQLLIEETWCTEGEVTTLQWFIKSDSAKIHHGTQVWVKWPWCCWICSRKWTNVSVWRGVCLSFFAYSTTQKCSFCLSAATDFVKRRSAHNLNTVSSLYYSKWVHIIHTQNRDGQVCVSFSLFLSLSLHHTNTSACRDAVTSLSHEEGNVNTTEV